MTDINLNTANLAYDPSVDINTDNSEFSGGSITLNLNLASNEVPFYGSTFDTVDGVSLGQVLDMSESELDNFFSNLSADDKSKVDDFFLDVQSRAVEKSTGQEFNAEVVRLEMVERAQKEVSVQTALDERVASGELTDEQAKTAMQAYQKANNQAVQSDDPVQQQVQQSMLKEARETVAEAPISSDAKLAEYSAEAEKFIDEMQQDMTLDTDDEETEDATSASSPGGSGITFKEIVALATNMLDKGIEDLRDSANSLGEDATAGDYMNASADAQLFGILSSSMSNIVKSTGEGFETIARG
jgi:hypothetical protein